MSNSLKWQPPSGGCVLKRGKEYQKNTERPAAFGRLCVETLKWHVVRNIISSRLRAAVC